LLYRAVTCAETNADNVLLSTVIIYGCTFTGFIVFYFRNTTVEITTIVAIVAVATVVIAIIGLVCLCCYKKKCAQYSLTKSSDSTDR